MNVSDKLYKLRTDRGLTQVDIGKIAGVSDKTISSWESGNRCPKIVPYVQNICKHFHLDMLTFIDEETDNMGYHTEQPTVGGLSELDQQILGLLSVLTDEQKRMLLDQLRVLTEGR